MEEILMVVELQIKIIELLHEENKKLNKKLDKKNRLQKLIENLLEKYEDDRDAKANA